MDDLSYTDISLLLTTSTVAYVTTALIISVLRPSKRTTEPSYFVIVSSLVIALASFYLNFGTPFLTGQCEEKIYDNFPSFYVRYLAEHEVPADRVAHLLIFSFAFISMAWNPRYFVTWILCLTTGSLVTRPLLGISTPFVEASIISSVAGGVSTFYGGQIGFFFIFSSYTLSDLVSHIFVANNGPAAIWVGQHYLGWGLWGQAKLVFTMYCTFFDSCVVTILFAGLVSFVITRIRWNVSPPNSPLYTPGKSLNIFITGAAGGLGKHLTDHFLSLGHTVIATDINLGGLKELEKGKNEKTRKRLVLAELDVTSSESWANAYKTGIARVGKIDVHINNAGYLKVGEGLHDTEREIHRHIDINTKGVVMGSQFAARHMLEVKNNGHIINIGSLASLISTPGLCLYSASKFAVRSYSLSLRSVLKGSGVDVSVVCPDAIQTPMLMIQVDEPSAALTFSGKILTPDQVFLLSFSWMVLKFLDLHDWNRLLMCFWIMSSHRDVQKCGFPITEVSFFFHSWKAVLFPFLLFLTDFHQVS